MRDVAFTPVDLTGGRCLACDANLTWHQPNIDDPDRMLGVCPSCGGWHLLHISFEAREAVFMLIPDVRQLSPSADGEASSPSAGTVPAPAVPPGDDSKPRRSPIRVTCFTLMR